MADAVRQAHVDRIEAAKRELKAAGPIHRKDLSRYIRRLEKELRTYDSYHRGWSSLAEKAHGMSG